ncbi:MAG: hypothetical protein IH840_14150 [Candidatus Heimdallarchaeota archaeon]|nr:hypothetical protein [Candidatus Heimdallarchaeota archaeon]
MSSKEEIIAEFVQKIKESITELSTEDKIEVLREIFNFTAKIMEELMPDYIEMVARLGMEEENYDAFHSYVDTIMDGLEKLNTTKEGRLIREDVEAMIIKISEVSAKTQQKILSAETNRKRILEYLDEILGHK